MGCDDSDGPGHAPRYLDVSNFMRLILCVAMMGIFAYIVIFGAIKIAKPDLVTYNDYYVWWYRYPSFPCRYVCALFGKNNEWKDGKWTLEGRNAYGDRVFLKNVVGVIRIDIYDDALIKRIESIKDGADVDVKFGRKLSYDSSTFEDYFVYYIADVQ